MTRTEELAMELRVFCVCIILVSLTLECLSKPVLKGTGSPSEQANVDLAHALVSYCIDLSL